MQQIWAQQWFGNDVKQWAQAAALAVVGALVLLLVRRIVVGHLRRLAAKTANRIDDIFAGTLERTSAFAVLALSIYLGGLYLKFNPQVEAGLRILLISALTLQGALWLQTFISLSLEEWRSRDGDNRGNASMAATIRFVSGLVIWTVCVLVVLANFGIELSAVITGLGIGGVAAALAVQNILGDLFSSLSIYFDRPFEIGDFVNVDDMLGNVERVGLRSTRIRSLSGEQLVFANADLAGSRIRNFGRLHERRIVFSLGVTYQTSHAQLKAIPGMIREVIEAHAAARFDRSHFATYGDFSLNFETVYYVRSADYRVYMDMQEAINLEIFKRFEEAGIEFAYPTQTLLLQRNSA